MKRRNFITYLGASIVTSMTVPSMAAINSVAELNSYFNSIRTAFAPFTQTDANGRKATGRFYLQKPGKMRFEYDSPNYPLTVADGNAVAIFDPKSNTGPQKIPQGQTPVSLLAKSNLDLTGTKFVREIREIGNKEYIITLADPAHANYGQLKLLIDRQTPTIKGWQAIDQAGKRTTIELGELRTGLEMNPDLFNIVKIEKSR